MQMPVPGRRSLSRRVSTSPRIFRASRDTLVLVSVLAPGSLSPKRSGEILCICAILVARSKPSAGLPAWTSDPSPTFTPSIRRITMKDPGRLIPGSSSANGWGTAAPASYETSSTASSSAKVTVCPPCNEGRSWRMITESGSSLLPRKFTTKFVSRSRLRINLISAISNACVSLNRCRKNSVRFFCTPSRG